MTATRNQELTFEYQVQVVKVVQIVRGWLYNIQELDDALVTPHSSKDMNFTVQTNCIYLLIKRRLNSFDSYVGIRSSRITIDCLSHFSIGSPPQYPYQFVSIAYCPIGKVFR
jgi:hypothetical protein